MDDGGVELLLELHGTEVHRDDGYWYRIEAWRAPVSKHIPHGVRYNLTLHDRYNQRVFGMDNAHGVKVPKRSKVSGKRYVYDHKHRSAYDKGVPYQFSSAYQLIEDFFNGIDSCIENLKRKRTY